MLILRVREQEIDYKNEARNAIRFRNQFKGVEWIKVPEVYEEVTTPRVIVMEYAPSVKISDVDKVPLTAAPRPAARARSLLLLLGLTVPWISNKNIRAQSSERSAIRDQRSEIRDPGDQSPGRARKR